MNIAFTQGKEEMMLPASSVYVPSMGNRTVEDLLNELNFKMGVSNAYPHVQIKDSVVADDSTYSSQKIESIAGGSHTYSTDEQIVGTWIDGSDVYEKTIVLENAIECSSGSWTSIGITANSLSISSYISCIGYTADGTCWNGVFIATINSNIAIMIVRPNETCWVKTLVIQYTKST